MCTYAQNWLHNGYAALYALYWQLGYITQYEGNMKA